MIDVLAVVGLLAIAAALVGAGRLLAALLRSGDAE